MPKVRYSWHWSSEDSFKRLLVSLQHAPSHTRFVVSVTQWPGLNLARSLARTARLQPCQTSPRQCREDWICFSIFRNQIHRPSCLWSAPFSPAAIEDSTMFFWVWVLERFAAFSTVHAHVQALQAVCSYIAKVANEAGWVEIFSTDAASPHAMADLKHVEVRGRLEAGKVPCSGSFIEQHWEGPSSGSNRFEAGGIRLK